MWPASTNVAWMPGRDLDLLVVVDRLEHRRGRPCVVLGVERRVEVDFDDAAAAPRSAASGSRRQARRSACGARSRATGVAGRRAAGPGRSRSAAVARRPRRRAALACGERAAAWYWSASSARPRRRLVGVAALPPLVALRELLLELARCRAARSRPARPWRSSGRSGPEASLTTPAAGRSGRGGRGSRGSRRAWTDPRRAGRGCGSSRWGCPGTSRSR